MKKLILLFLTATLFSFGTNQSEKTVSIKLTIPQAEIVLKALSKLPYDESAPIINEIQIQASKQLSDTTKKK